VCLGHQGIGEVYGATLYNIPKVLHGVTSQVEIKDTDEYMFNGVNPVFQATHYHSWAVMPESFTPELKITAVNNEGLVMALRHTRYDVRGVQFHPESIMTPEGPKMIENWLKH
jgi:anthranilate synthase component II